MFRNCGLPFLLCALSLRQTPGLSFSHRCVQESSPISSICWFLSNLQAGFFSVVVKSTVQACHVLIIIITNLSEARTAAQDFWPNTIFPSRPLYWNFRFLPKTSGSQRHFFNAYMAYGFSVTLQGARHRRLELLGGRNTARNAINSKVRPTRKPANQRGEYLVATTTSMPVWACAK